MKINEDLIKFISPYSLEVQTLALDLMQFVKKIIPEANELIWDNYNAVAIAYSKTEKLKDAFCHVAIYSKHVNFGFNRGSELSKSDIKLEGNGKLIRHIKVTEIDKFPKDLIEKLLFEAIGISEDLNSEIQKTKKSIGKSIIMSISEKKIRPK